MQSEADGPTHAAHDEWHAWHVSADVALPPLVAGLYTVKTPVVKATETVPMPWLMSIVTHALISPSHGVYGKNVSHGMLRAPPHKPSRPATNDGQRGGAGAER